MSPNRIRELRLERAKIAPGAFTLAAVAQRLGVTEWTVRAWEHGRSRPTARHARRLAREFGVSIEDLGLAAPEPAQEGEPAAEERRAQRQAWARQSTASPPQQSSTRPPRSDRPRGI